MKKFTIAYYQKLKNTIDDIAVTDQNGTLIDFPAGVEITAQLIIDRTRNCKFFHIDCYLL